MPYTTDDMKESNTWLLRAQGREVNTMELEFFCNVTTGKACLATDGDAYADRRRKAGLDDIVAAYQKLHGPRN
jgi:hypothetical protein